MPSIIRQTSEASGDLTAYEFATDLIPNSHVVYGASEAAAGLVASGDFIVGFGTVYIGSVIVPGSLDCVLPRELRPLADGQQLLSSWDESEGVAGFVLASFGVGENGLPYVSIDYPATGVHLDVDDSVDFTGIVRLRA